jgi:hypothetical protein
VSSVAIQNFQINNRTTSIDLNQVPALSRSSKIVLEKLNKELDDSVQTIDSLKGKAEMIQKTQSTLQDARIHATRDKAIAALKTLVLVFAITLFIAACIIDTPAIPVAVAIVISTLLFVFLSAHSVASIVNEVKNCKRAAIFNPLVSLENERYVTVKELITLLLGPYILGIFAPLYQAFTRIPRLEKTVEQQKELFKVVAEQEQATFAKAAAFYQREGQQLRTALQEATRFQKQQQSQLQGQSAEEVRKGVFLPNEEIDRVSLRLRTLNKAEAELENVLRFYENYH